MGIIDNVGNIENMGNSENIGNTGNVGNVGNFEFFAQEIRKFLPAPPATQPLTTFA